MNVLKLIKLHYNYLFSKKNLIIIIISFTLLQLINIYCWLSNVNLAASPEQIIDITWETIFTFEKILLVNSSIFLMGSFFIQENDDYYVLFVSQNTSKYRFVISKVATLTIFILFYNLISFVIFILFGYIFNRYFVFKAIYLISFIVILLLSLIYGFLSIIIVKLFSSSLSVIITLFISLMSDLFIDINILNLIIPSYTLGFSKFALIVSFIEKVFVLFLYSILCIILNLRKK